jgi:ectoine hydroxylase-related dioxygenase (phytanoyl-CoA dioxygenase family)
MLISNIKSISSKRLKKNNQIKIFYEKHGWVIIKRAINLKLIFKIKKDLNHISYALFEKSFEKSIEYLNKKNQRKLFEFHKLINKLISSSFPNSKINEIFNIILNNKKPNFNIGTTFMLGLVNDKRLIYNYHQESSYMKNLEDITSIHFPIFRKTNFKNGTMSVLDKSHKMMDLPYKKIVKKNSYTDLIPENIEEILKNYKEIFLNINVGDIIFFHKNLIHKSNLNNSKKPRVCFVGRFTQDHNVLKFIEASAKNL